MRVDFELSALLVRPTPHVSVLFLLLFHCLAMVELFRVATAANVATAHYVPVQTFACTFFKFRHV